MEYLPGIVITLSISTIVAILWVKGIVNMNKKHTDYKGDDFFDWESAEAPWVEKYDEEATDWHPNETL